MILLRDNSVIPDSCKAGVLALGNFDGLHLGHQAILAEAVRRARATGVAAGVMTFEPHPRRLFRPQDPGARLLPLASKLRLLKETGLDFVRVVRFIRAFSELSAQEFIRQHLKADLGVSQVVTGEDFTFGHRRGGTVELLKSGTWGFDAIACPSVLVQGERCSSTWLRKVLGEGDVVAASRLLGRQYSITGRVCTGDKRGRQLGFPTANIVPYGLFLPANGVYAVRVMSNGNEYAGVANLGNRPTFSGSEVRLEVHLFDFTGDLYGKKIDTSFIEPIRGERKFDGIEALKTQIAQDCETARRILA